MIIIVFLHIQAVLKAILQEATCTQCLVGPVCFGFLQTLGK